MKRCVLNVAFGESHTPRQHRLIRSLDRTGYADGRLLWSNRLPPGSLRHNDIPFAFKAAAFAEARRQGYETLLWLDVTGCANKPLDSLFAQAEDDGHLLVKENDPIGLWTADRALPALGVGREQAMSIPMCWAGCMCVCLAHERSRTWLNGFIAGSEDRAVMGGRLHRAKWSADSRVRGDRPEEVLASVLAWRSGMVLDDSGQFVGPPGSTAVIYRR